VPAWPPLPTPMVL